MPDPYYEYIKDTAILRESFHNGMMFFREIEDVCLALFPCSLNYEPLFILCEESSVPSVNTIAKMITSERGNDIFNHGFSMFLKGVVYELLIVGNAYYSIYWDERNEHIRDHILPVNFSYLRTETVKAKKKRGKIVGYIQEYSSHAKNKYRGSQSTYPPGEHKGEEWRYEFTPEEALHFKYPFGEKTPVQKSLPHFYSDKIYSDGLLRMQLSIPSRKKSFKMERLRFKTFRQSQEDHNTKRSKISKEFFYIIGMDSSPMTLYYAAYRISESYKKLNLFRNHLIDTFNSKVMKVISEKNGMSQNLYLKPNPDIFSTDDEIDSLFEDFKVGKVDLLEMYKRIKKKDNQ